LPARQSRDAFHGELAYLGHEPPLKGDLSGRENLRYAIGIRRAVTGQEIDAALERTGAHSFADRAVRTLSAGQRRRVALAGVLLAGAVLWLLDEPTTNLDAEGQAARGEPHRGTAGSWRHRRGGGPPRAFAVRRPRRGSRSGGCVKTSAVAVARLVVARDLRLAFRKPSQLCSRCCSS
jgi:hypothetical protein